HVSRCERCANRLALSRQLDANLGTMLRTTFKLPSLAADHVSAGYAQIARQPSRLPSIAIRRSSFALGAMAVFLLGTAALFGLANFTVVKPNQRTVTPTPQKSIVAVLF